MPAGEALKTIESTLSTQFQDSFSSHFRLSMRALVHLDGAGRPDYAYPFRNMPYLEVRRSPHRGPFGAYYPEGYRDRYGSEGLHFFDSQADAERFASGVNRLIWENLPEQQAKQRVDFESVAATWRATAVKPTMPDEAHVHQVLAENAVQEKSLSKAIYEYEAALDIFPTWPIGQFNVALICGETGDYDCAVEHMQDYLELVPNAPDAQAAKDKLIIWKDKLSSSENSQAPPPQADSK